MNDADYRKLIGQGERDVVKLRKLRDQAQAKADELGRMVVAGEAHVRALKDAAGVP